MLPPNARVYIEHALLVIGSRAPPLITAEVRTDEAFSLVPAGPLEQLSRGQWVPLLGMSCTCNPVIVEAPVPKKKKSGAPRSLLYYHLQDLTQEQCHCVTVTVDRPQGWGTGIRFTDTVSRVCQEPSILGVDPKVELVLLYACGREPSRESLACVLARLGMLWAASVMIWRA